MSTMNSAYTYTACFYPHTRVRLLWKEFKLFGPRAVRLILPLAWSCMGVKILAREFSECHVMCAYRLAQLRSPTPRYWAHLLGSNVRSRLLSRTERRLLSSKITVSC